MKVSCRTLKQSQSPIVGVVEVNPRDSVVSGGELANRVGCHGIRLRLGNPANVYGPSC
jgi:hypothetical protein